MELNNQLSDHDKASVSLKILLLILAIVLIITLGYLVWLQNNESTENFQVEQINTPVNNTPPVTIEHGYSTNDSGKVTVFTFQLPSGYGAFKESSFGGDAVSTIYHIGQLKDKRKRLYEINEAGGPGLKIKVTGTTKLTGGYYSSADEYALSYGLSDSAKIKNIDISGNKAVVYYNDSKFNTIHIITIKTGKESITEHGDKDADVNIVNIVFPLTLLSSIDTYSNPEEAAKKAFEHPLLKSILNSLRFN